jgi:hypothetical protein
MNKIISSVFCLISPPFYADISTIGINFVKCLHYMNILAIPFDIFLLLPWNLYVQVFTNIFIMFMMCHLVSCYHTDELKFSALFDSFPYEALLQLNYFCSHN